MSNPNTKKSGQRRGGSSPRNEIGIDWATTPLDVEQFRMGMEVEFEHGSHDPQTNVTNDDPVLTAKIALAHLKVPRLLHAAQANGRRSGLLSSYPVRLRSSFLIKIRRTALKLGQVGAMFSEKGREPAADRPALRAARPTGAVRTDDLLLQFRKPLDDPPGWGGALSRDRQAGCDAAHR